MAEHIESTKITEFKECFNLYDRDGDGLVSEEQALLVMRSLGQPISQRELRDMMGKLGKTKVTFPEILEFMWKFMQRPRNIEAEILAAFQIYDKQKSGTVSIKDLRHVLTRTGEKMKPRDFDYMLKTLGVPSNSTHMRYADIARVFGNV